MRWRIFCTPVGPYFKGGAKPITIRVSDYDRAAPNGTGHIKAGLNYAMSLHAIVEAHEQGYAENMYLDSATRTKVEETGGANFLFVTKDGKFGMKDHQGNILLSPTYDFLRTCYIYNDDLSIMPVIAEKNGKMGLVMPDGNDTVVADFLYDEICLRDEYPYFEASREGISGFIDKFGNFVNS